MNESDILVQFSAVQKTYDGDSMVVKNLDLAIPRGEFLTLLGPSGSGKTTTLMMLAGFEVPTSGEITLGGVAINHLPPHRRNIGMVFQNYALFPHMTVARNVAFPLEVRRLPKAEIARKVEEALARVRLDSFAHRHPAQLSGGQQQRVALARAMVFSPDLILMDEPLGALDKQLREHMQMEIKHLHRQFGLTIVYVTHDQSEALTMSDRVAVFNDGLIQQIDSPARIYLEPRNSFVANFIGENNNLDGVVEQIDDESCLVRLGGGELVRARRVNVYGTDRPTTLSVRPERLFLGSGPADALNRLPARVVETVYLGDHLRVLLRLPDGPQVMVKILERSAIAVPAVGEETCLWFREEDCRALDPVRSGSDQ